MQKSEKAVIIEGMKEIAGKSSIAVMTEFKGMTVEESTNLRVDLRKVGAEYHVIKTLSAESPSRTASTTQ